MLQNDLYEALCEVPVIDVHSHINRDQIGAENLQKVLMYHMLLYPLRSAGIDDRTLWPNGLTKAIDLSMDDWFRAWPAVQHTGFGWMLRTILRDLYEFDKPLTKETLPQLQEAFDSQTSRDDWAKHVLGKGNVVRLFSSVLNVDPLGEDEWDPGIRFTIESTPGCGKGEYKGQGWGRRMEAMGKILNRQASSVEDMREAVTAFYDSKDWTNRNALVAWISGEADFTPIDDAQANAILAEAMTGDEKISKHTRRVLEGLFVRSICEAIRGKVPILQLCYGTQYLTPEPQNAHPVQKAAPQMAETFAHLLGDYPEIHFNMLNGYEPQEPIWCGLVQGYGNLSLANFWWQCFYPTVMHNAWARRLDMAPLSRLIGFFSDGWSIDYVYGRLTMVRRVMANVFAEKIQRGFLNRDEALCIAREIFFQTPKSLFLPNEDVRV